MGHSRTPDDLEGTDQSDGVHPQLILQDCCCRYIYPFHSDMVSLQIQQSEVNKLEAALHEHSSCSFLLPSWDFQRIAMVLGMLIELHHSQTPLPHSLGRQSRDHEAQNQAAQLDSISHLTKTVASKAVFEHSTSPAEVAEQHTALSEQPQPRFEPASLSECPSLESQKQHIALRSHSNLKTAHLHQSEFLAEEAILLMLVLWK